MPLESLTVVLALDCNLRCDYCCVDKVRQRSLQWPLMHDALARLLPRAGSNLLVGFTGGEPLLRFDALTRIVAYIRRRAPPHTTVRWAVVTNGLLLDEQVMRFFERYQFSVTLSCDGGPDAQALRGRHTFRRLDSLFDRLRQRHGDYFRNRVRVNMTVSPATVQYLSDSVDYLIGKRVSQVTLSPAIGSLPWQVDNIDELQCQFRRVARTLRNHYRRTGTVPLALFRKTRDDDAPRRSREWTCGAPLGVNAAVDVDGQVYGCIVATPAYHPWSPTQRHAGADALHLTGAMDAARACSVFHQGQPRYSSYGRCSDCKFRSRCHICPLALPAEPDATGARRVPDFLCAFNRAAFAARARFPNQPSLYERMMAPLPRPGDERRAVQRLSSLR